MLKILDLQTAEDSRDIVHRSVQALVEGQLVGLPTETSYAIAAHALCQPAVERLVAIAKGSRELAADEGREMGEVSKSGAFSLSIRSREAAIDYLGEDSSTARRLMHRCWPGPLTIQVECCDPLSAVSQLPENVRKQLFCQQSRINFRVVDHDVLNQIHRYLSAPLVLFSHSNCNHGEVVATAATLADRYRHDLPLLLDDGPTRYGGRTTVVCVSGNRWEILREGVIERAAMNQFVKPVIALVCTGNTCRSPMAETLMREQLRKRTGCEDAVRVLSAGVAASAGSGASPHAVAVMGKRGLDLTGHSSRPLDESVMNVADLVLTMTRGHRAAILAAWPEMHDRIFTLRRDGGDISDPVGMDLEVYQTCADQIEEELGKWLDSLDGDFFPISETESNNETEPNSES